MYNDHDSFCSCYDCVSNHYVGNHRSNFVEEKNTEPGYYIGSTLIAKRYVTAYRLPDQTSKVFKKFAPGDKVGVVNSYILKGNLVWWMLKGGGYVIHFPGYFDSVTAQSTASGKAFNEDMNKAHEMGDLMPSFDFLSHWKLILAGVLGVIVLALFLRLKG